MIDPMRPLPRVEVSGTTFFVDSERPVAMLRRAGHPNTFVTWPELSTGDHCPEVSLHAADNALWVVYSSWDEGGDERYPALASPTELAAVRINADGGTHFVKVRGARLLGVGHEGLWTGTSMAQDMDDDYTGGQLPEGYSHPNQLQLHRPPLPPLTIDFDRYVHWVHSTRRGIKLWVNPSPAITHPDGDDGAGYEYRCTALTLPPLDSLGGELRFRNLVPRGWGRKVSQRQLLAVEEERVDSAKLDTERIDMSGVSGSRWRLAELSRQQREQAIAAMAGQFSNAEHYWQSTTGGAAPLSEGMKDVQVQVIGAWPRTRIEVSFTHPHYPWGRMCRTLDVFDAAGRIIFNPYADINLMEDLDTGHLPDPAQAREGILEI